MNLRVLDVYVGEVRTQCQFALNAAGAINNVIQRMSIPEIQANHAVRTKLHSEIFRTVHSILTHTSNISKLLWPPGPRRRRGESPPDYQARRSATIARGHALRSALGIPDEGHLLKDRQLRDHLEHFDERLDDWAATKAQGGYIYMQDTIGPIEALRRMGGTAQSESMRGFDPDSLHMHFRGEAYDLQALIDAVEQVMEAATAAQEELWGIPNEAGAQPVFRRMPTSTGEAGGGDQRGEA